MRRPARGAATAGVAMAVGLALSACTDPDTGTPECEPDQRLAIVAQSVPTASLVPCVAEMPAGWSFAALDVESGRTRLWLNSDRAGLRAVEVELTASCNVRGATLVRAEEEGARRYRRLTSLSPMVVGTTYDVFPGGCVRYRYEFPRGPHLVLIDEFDDALELFSRKTLREEVRRDLGFDMDP